jgi:hypothetical protein
MVSNSSRTGKFHDFADMLSHSIHNALIPQQWREFDVSPPSPAINIYAARSYEERTRIVARCRISTGLVAWLDNGCNESCHWADGNRDNALPLTMEEIKHAINRLMTRGQASPPSFAALHRRVS